MIIRLHWDIWRTMVSRHKKRIEGLWGGTRLAGEGDIRYYEFKEEELLIYLCSHMVDSDGCRQLRYVCDINEFIRRYDCLADWDNVIKKAKEWKLSSSLYIGLVLGKELLGSPIPDKVLKKIKPFFPKRIFIKFFVSKKFVLRNTARKRLINVLPPHIFFDLTEAQSSKEHLSVFKRVLFPPKEIMGNRTYVLRLFRGHP